MFHTVVTLVCNPASPCLDGRLAQRALKTVLALDYGAVSRRVLNAGVAEDLFVEEAAPREHIEMSLRAALDDAPVDIIVQPTAHRRKRLLIADMDSTIIEQECLDELAGYAGLKEEIAAVTERAMRGEIDFEEALRARVARLKGLAAETLEATFRDKITLTPGAGTLVRTMAAQGAVTALVSGGFTFFTERVAARAGFTHHRANRLEIDGGALAGTVAEPILGRAAKRDSLMEFAREAGVNLAETLAVGDGANDLAMIEAAGLGVAFRAKPAVAAAADAGIVHGDLTALLYAQGLTPSEFVG